MEEVQIGSITKHLAFLTAYSNEKDGEDVEFKIWDASACQLYTELDPVLDFDFNGSVGTPINPELISTQNLVLREIPIHNGWNWISFNLEMPDNSLGAVMESLERPDNLFVRYQELISQYLPEGEVWEGPLTALNSINMFQVRGTQADTIDLVGRPLDLDAVSIPIVDGWNWIGYLPQFGASVDTSLKSLNPVDGDIVKSQTHFAQYVADIGWIGSLDFMEAPNGYLLRSSHLDTLVQAQVRDSGHEAALISTNRSGIWEVNPSEFEFSMNVIAIVESDALNVLKEDDEVGAFFGDEVRGATSAHYVEALDKYVLFLTVFSNEHDEMMSFKYRDAATGEIHDLQQEHEFSANDIMGTVQVPEIFTMELINSTLDPAEALSLQVIPNPFVDETFLHFALPQPAEVSIQVVDILGNRIQTMELDLGAGPQKVGIPATLPDGSKMIPGYYLVKLEADGIRATEKILLIK